MDWTRETLGISFLMLAVALPFFSALAVSKERGFHWASAYFLCLCAYLAAFGMIAMGFVFQGTLQSLQQVNRYWGGWDTIWETFRFAAQDIGWQRIGVNACIIQFMVLLAKDIERVPILGFRAAFLALTLTDILTGMLWGFGANDYITNVLFNLIGAVAFSAINTLMIKRLLWRRALRRG